MRLSIRWKLLLSISLPLLITYTIMLVWDYQRVREGAIAQMQSYVLERAQVLANGINSRLDSVSQSAETLTMSLLRSGESSAAGTRVPLRFGVTNRFAVATHIISDTDGRATILSIRRGAGGARQAARPLAAEPELAALYEQVRRDLKPHWGQVQMESTGRQMISTYAEPIMQDEKVRGAVLVDINVNDLVRNRFARGPGRNDPTSRPLGEAEPLGRPSNEPSTQPAAGIADQLRRLIAAAPDRRPGDATTKPGESRTGDDGSFAQPDRSSRRGGPVDAFRERNFERRGDRFSTTQLAEALAQGRGPDDRDFRGGGPPPEPPAEEIAPTTGTSFDPDSNAIELFDRDGRPISMRLPAAARPQMSVLQWADEHNLPDFIKAFHAAQNGESGIAQVPGLADIAPGFKPGETYWIALTPIKETGWVYSAAIPESQVIGPLLQRLQQRALFLAAGLIVILIVATIVAFRLSQPIVHMAGAVRELAKGNLDARVTGVKSRDELGQLARAFNAMTGQLKAHVKALTEQTAVREKAESELRIARQIQTDLLPRTFPPFPDRPEFDLHAVNIPAAGVAGDFYDFFFVADDWLTICIADVSGKGVPAALLMAVTRTIVRNLARAGLPLQTICERANEMLLADTSNNMFVTMFLAQYHPMSGHLRYVNAGHPRPFIFKRGGEVQPFGNVTSPLLGVCELCEIGPIESAEALLEVGQTLLLYTDGVTEARAADGRMLRDPGAMQLVHAHDGEDVATFCASMVAAIDAYQDHHPADDITILALRRKS